MKVENDRDSSDDSDEDEESIKRLREAVDSETLSDNLYSQKTVNNEVKSPIENVAKDNSVVPSLVNLEDPLSLSNYCKKLVSISKSKSFKPQLLEKDPLKSLRRDKQDDAHQSPVISELEVTPQFQKFVGNKLDLFLDSQIQHELKNNSLVSTAEQSSNLKLLNASRKVVSNIDFESQESRKRLRPDLLAHTKVVTSDDDISSCVVSGQTILSGEQTRGWVNKFPDRVEPGVERIKKKKKKVKKKKSKTDADTVIESS